MQQCVKDYLIYFWFNQNSVLSLIYQTGQSSRSAETLNTLAMELNLENLKKFKADKSLASALSNPVVKEMITLLQEEIKYLDHWQKQELSELSRTQMKERAEFIQITLSKTK